MIQRSPRYTLFPYTTLFRSYGSLASLGIAYPDFRQLRLAAAEQIDRKSTRLNSSHVKISYAVFCSKKKTKTTYANPHAISLADPANHSHSYNIHKNFLNLHA